jgi:pteridine reductase
MKNNKVILITGGAKRIGAAIAEHLHNEGCNIIIHYRESDKDAKALQKKLNKKRANSTQIIQADLLKFDSYKQVIDKSIKFFGRIDCLINNASSYYPTPLDKVNDKSWMDLIGSNLKAPLFLSKEVCKYLKKTKGSIINITDTHIKRPKKKFIIYSVAKAGLVTLTHSLAHELAPEIRVNAVAPGPIIWPTNMKEYSDQYKKNVISETLLKKIGNPTDIAKAVSFLINNADYITGHVLEVDGGRSFSL